LLVSPNASKGAESRNIHIMR